MPSNRGGDRGRKPRDPVERFWEYVHKTRSCWIWTGPTNNNGYGTFSVGSRRDGTRRSVMAHCFALELAGIEVPPGHEGDHVCRNRLCVRIGPRHVRVCTIFENRGQFQRSKTHCVRGHQFPPARNGKRRCPKCHLEDVRKAYYADWLPSTRHQRPNKLTPKQRAAIQRQAQQGTSPTKLAEKYGVTLQAIHYWIKRG